MNTDVLIVDDEIDICYLLSVILKNKNFTVTYVNTINEAEKRLAIDNPSILFIDNNLPDGDGVDLIERVKKDHPQIKIVMITAHDTRADRERALSRGANVFIGKPFTTETIYKTLDVLFSKTA